MRFLLISLLAIMLPAGILAQSNEKMFITTQFCGPWEDVMNTPKKYKEAMLFTGTGVQFATNNMQPYTGGMFFFVNQDTGTWSIINVYGDGMACMAQTGKEFKPYVGNQPWDKPKGDGL